MTDADSVYARLSEPFDHTYEDTRGGVTFDYLTGEQVASRLNEVLGPAGWAFDVREHGINTEADEYWVLAELTACIDGVWVRRAQFGSQKLKRSRTSGTILDIGFDAKGAATDAMKKCASLLGVGLYLSRKEQTANRGRTTTTRSQAGGQSSGNAASGVRMVTSVRAPIMQRYATLLEEYAALDGDPNPWKFELPAPEADVTRLGQDLVKAIKRIKDDQSQNSDAGEQTA